ncbi:MAG TPA: type 1 glutamine amidotransferase domain-containing protein [Bryobacteraceae bacterium]|nr:type 1 glutamine amidotransferase domain-containing protein [Bryobacteraceae bacterium]
MSDLHELRVAIVATDGVEEIELTSPLKALREAGAHVDVIADHAGQIQGFEHQDKAGKIIVDRTLDEISLNEYDALMLPGGALNADRMRAHPKLRHLIYEFDRGNLPMAVICHAPWELISAGIVNGRTLTSWPTIQDDVRNAGGRWEDKEVVVDANLVTSRGPKDLPAFNREMRALFSRIPAEAHR